MTISCLHHINIQTNKLEETRDFYERVLGLYVGARPEFGQEGYWLFVPGTDHPIVHLSPRNDGGPEQTVDAGNRLDHVAFFGHDLEKTLAWLDELGVPYEERPDRLYLDSKMVQVFLKDPNGISLEFCCLTRDVGNEDDVTMQERAEISIERWLGDNYIQGRISARAPEPALTSD